MARRLTAMRANEETTDRQTSDVSVVVPVFNGEAYLGDTIGSIISQTMPPKEILVINDGSTDRSAEIASQFGSPVKCISQEHAGAASARNHGVRRATGKYLSFLDADDLWLAEKIEKQLALLLDTDSPTGVFSLMEQFLSPELPPQTVPRPVLPGVSSCTLLIRRDHFDLVGEFSTQWSGGEFIDWYSRAKNAGLQFKMVQEILAKRRLHNGNLNRQEDWSSDYAAIVRQAIQRSKKKDSVEKA